MKDNETWDAAGLAELDNIEKQVRAEMANKTTWFALPVPERMARESMLRAIKEIKKEAAQ